MTSPLDTFELFAELSVALGGFTGVAASFGGRDREFREIEKIRIVGVFLFAGFCLVGSLLVISLTHAGVSANATYAATLLVSGLLVLWYLGTQVPSVFKLFRAGESSTSGGYLLFSFAYLVVLVVLFFWAALFEREPWPLIVGISSQLVYGLWIFARLLLRAN